VKKNWLGEEYQQEWPIIKALLVSKTEHLMEQSSISQHSIMHVYIA
jgi:hypothetical protein